MEMRNHRGFVIQAQKKVKGYIAEIYHKGKLIHTARSGVGQEGHFQSAVLAIEAAREWIDRTYPQGRIKYFGEVD